MPTQKKTVPLDLVDMLHALGSQAQIWQRVTPFDHDSTVVVSYRFVWQQDDGWRTMSVLTYNGGMAPSLAPGIQSLAAAKTLQEVDVPKLIARCMKEGYTLANPPAPEPEPVAPEPKRRGGRPKKAVTE